jgi:hypothetical protein
MLALCLLFTLAANALGADAVQTDWTGGYGVPGPVTQWQGGFATTQDVDWAAAPGELVLVPALPIEHLVTSSITEPASATVADIDGDGDLDIVSTAYQGNEVAWWENDGAGGGWERHTIAVSFVGACNLCACDPDNDGDADVAATAEGGNKVAWWENDGTGGGWVEHVVESAIGSPYSVVPADFDRDLDSDFLGAAFSAGDVVWWENTDGAGVAWSRHTIDANFPGAWAAVAGDINGDTAIDVVAVAFSVHDVCWFENSGDGATWTKHVIDANFPSPLSVRAQDMDGDTDLDVLAASYGSQIAWWENDGAGDGWSKHTVATGLSQPFSTRAVDLDGDGDQDVLANERAGDRVLWFENVGGGGLLWIRHVVDATCDGPNDVLAADLNGDLRQDVISTYSWDNSIVWYELVNTFAPGGYLESSILDAGGPVHDWGSLNWNCVSPPGTSVSVAVRASSNHLNMGAWAAVASPGEDLSNYVNDGTAYFQYRVSMTTAEGAVSPRFQDVSVSWDYTTGVGANEEPPSRVTLRGTTPNPAVDGEATVRFSLPHSCVVDLTLFDTEGRKARTIASGLRAAGEHAAVVHGLPAGVYFIRLEAADSRCDRKLIVD